MKYNTLEVELYYNPIDDRHYIYIGEDYYYDTEDTEIAFTKFEEAKIEVKKLTNSY